MVAEILSGKEVAQHVRAEVAERVSALKERGKAVGLATVLVGDSPHSYNDIAHPDRVAPVKTRVEFTDGVVSLPPHSLTIVHVLTL